MSLVLGGNPKARVAAANRERVRRAAAELGYRPNLLARGLVRQRSYAVGVLVPDLGNPFFAEVVRGVERVAGQNGYAVLLSDARETPPEKQIEALRARQVDGVILDALGVSSLTGEALEDWNVVLVDEPSARFPGVMSDAFQAGLLMGEHLLELGHRSFAFVGPAVDAHSFRMRERGFVQALRGAGVGLASERLRRAPPSSAPTICSPSARSRNASTPGSPCQARCRSPGATTSRWLRWSPRSSPRCGFRRGSSGRGPRAARLLLRRVEDTDAPLRAAPCPFARCRGGPPDPLPSPEMRHATIVGTGSHVPERVLTNAELSATVGEDIDPFVSGVLGIRERRVCAPDESTADLAEAAARRALDDAGVRPGDIDLLIVSTDTPEYISPATSSVLHGRLGLSKRAGTFDVNSACSGFATALDTAWKFIRQERGEQALRQVLGSLDSDERRRVRAASATDEVPLAVLLNLWRAADRVLGLDDPTWMERAGAYSIDSLGAQMYGGILRKSSPREFLTQRISLFQLYYHPGDMQVVEETPGHAVLRLVDLEAGAGDRGGEWSARFARPLHRGWRRLLRVGAGLERRGLTRRGSEFTMLVLTRGGAAW